MRTFICTFLLTLIWSVGNTQHIGITLGNDGNKSLLWVINKYPCPITLSATASNPDTTFKAYLPSNDKRILIKDDSLHNIFDDPKQELDFNFILGNPEAVHDEAYQYSLPYPPGSSYILTQGNDTPYSHSSTIAKYAYDFAMPKGSFVAAARGGVVGYVVERNEIGGDNIELMKKSNRVMVCHNDGTIAAYAHLQHKGALVEVGDRVFAGQVIGLSGNTGYTTAPHLHFTVLIGDKSIPIQFRNRNSNLVEGQAYEHK